jgi:rare lipoprotein A
VRLRLSQLLCVVLLGGVLVFMSDGYGEAEGGWASYYGAELAGSPTASGDSFDPYGFTAAHKTLPLGTQLTVNYAGRSVQVTVNDRGPYTAGRDLDLSQGAAEYLGLTQSGVDYVDYAVVGSGYGGEIAAGDQPYSATAEHESYSGGATGASLSNGDESYVVQPGDTLTGIAAELGTTTGALAAANGLQNPDLLTIGQTLAY